jgi:hypothetical protein
MAFKQKFYQFKNKIIFNFVIFVATKKVGQQIFPPLNFRFFHQVRNKNVKTISACTESVPFFSNKPSKKYSSRDTIKQLSYVGIHLLNCMIVSS